MSSDNTPPRTDPGVAEADRDWFGGRRWTGIAAIGVVILIGLCVVILLVVRRNDDDPSPAAGPQPVSTGGQAATSPSSALPTTIPTSAPAGVRWSIYETVALPSIDGVGPTKVDGAIGTGYAHTPTGALLATVNEGYRYQLAPDSQWQAAARAMLSRGVGYDAWMRVRGAHPYGIGGAAGNDTLAQVAGFQFVSYTPSDAVVQIVTRDSKGVYQVGSQHVRWTGTDWVFVTGPDGGQAANVQQVDSLAGFIEWRGV